MIIDRIQLAGLEAYFQAPGQPGAINLGGANPKTSRTTPLGKGKQRGISAIHLLIEANDLLPLFNRQQMPLLRVSVMKEMFPGLFADPYKHRVHNIAGFGDFNRGALENCKAMDIDGIPTLVSIGTGTCKWKSMIYPMPDPVSFDAASWELATSRLTPADSFTYFLRLNYWAPNQALDTVPQQVILANNLDPTVARKKQPLNLNGIGSYQLEFEADVTNDSYFYEKHTPIVSESIGRPLLRAVNLLEPLSTPVESIYTIYSLDELLSQSSDYELFDFQGQPLRKMRAVLDLSATLVSSEAQVVVNNDPYNAGSEFESVELAILSNQFTSVEARIESETLLRINQ
jgi:hypothetical protein